MTDFSCVHIVGPRRPRRVISLRWFPGASIVLPRLVSVDDYALLNPDCRIVVSDGDECDLRNSILLNHAGGPLIMADGDLIDFYRRQDDRSYVRVEPWEASEIITCLLDGLKTAVVTSIGDPVFAGTKPPVLINQGVVRRLIAIDTAKLPATVRFDSRFPRLYDLDWTLALLHAGVPYQCYYSLVTPVRSAQNYMPDAEEEVALLQKKWGAGSIVIKRKEGRIVNVIPHYHFYRKRKKHA
jgi:hypothetical protein